MSIKVHFSSKGEVLVGDLYLPDDLKKGERRAAVITVSPGSGIKEQISGRYAKELRDRGFIALAFDHTSFGESTGFPRFEENPYVKVEDIKNAVTFLCGRSEVDAEKVAVMGICGGGGYAPYAAATDRRIKACATVSGMTNIRQVFMDQIKGDRSFLEMSGKARQAFARGEPAQYTDVIQPNKRVGKRSRIAARGSVARQTEVAGPRAS